MPTETVSAISADAVRESLRGDVLALGLSHLLLIAFFIALILSVVSLLVYTTLNAQSRRDQFAVLRALGLSSGRIALSVTLEQIVLFVVAMLLGGVMGVLLSQQVLPSLAISSGGGAITPPFQVEIEVTALLQYFAALDRFAGIGPARQRAPDPAHVARSSAALSGGVAHAAVVHPQPHAGGRAAKC